MTANKNILLGVGILAVVAAVMMIFLVPNLLDNIVPGASVCGTRTELYTHGGYRFFEDEDTMSILRDKYCLDITGNFRLGTFAMSDEYHDSVDCVFPASRTGLDYFEAQHPGAVRRYESNYQSPIVVYAWQEYLPGLEAAGLVHTEVEISENETEYAIHYLQMDALIQAMDDDQTWRDLGVDIPGDVNVESTDPLASSSGLMWLALMATYRVPGNEHGDRVVTLDDLNANPDILPALLDYWEMQGLQREATNKLYAKFIETGAGLPMIVSYENTYIGWYELELPDNLKPQAQRIVGLYPAEQTLITEHILISTSPACDQLVDIFSTDAEIERIAWEHFGLRNGAGGIGARPGSAPWLAETVYGLSEPRQDVADAIKARIEAALSPEPTLEPSQ